jgi:primosomal protein N' (replication factor Y) (superfamily II helicase)
LTPKFVTVIFPLALPKLYTYSVPAELAQDIVVGIRVEVSLKNKLYSALVAEVHEDIELVYKPKPIISAIDKLPMVTTIQLQFWHWMADYYCCTIGEVMNVAMPSGLKLESETKVVFNGNIEDLDQSLTDDEYLIAEAVSIQNELTILQIQDILNKKTVFPVLRNLLDKRIISIKEELIEKFKPKTASFITLHEIYQEDLSKLNEAFDLVARSEKQTKALLAFVQVSRNKNFTQSVSDICQLAHVDTSVIQRHCQKEYFHHFKAGCQPYQ